MHEHLPENISLRDKGGNDLGSFYADVFVTCVPDDRTGGAAHFPTVVVEVLSEHVGEKFTRKQRAYLRSAKLQDYIIIDSRDQCTYRYSWKFHAETNQRRLVMCQQLRGALAVPSLGLIIPFTEIHAETDVPVILHPIDDESHAETDVLLDKQ